ncbi:MULTISPECIES: MFS transporter [Pacificibacter]|uniref:MFS transporter n=1 Tax=Pacificibacter TaxID=1042323 RepID=UPI001C0A5041|nr:MULTISPECIES: MFS transporter [Pacificibacter]MBU2937257.1 MFS transporter [Pacificibacter marinus]MDO6615252.1 MFS transporter [Pacificibacter sp. 1_MG-2023]
MIKGLVWLIVAYSLSQFYRACLAVFAPVLKTEIGLQADQVSTALGIWFLIFAAMQIPVGWLLDHRSPRKSASILLAIGGGGGALVFAMAQGPWGIYTAMALIGIGCSPVLMLSLYIFARSAPTDRFGTLAGLVVGLGSLGNLAASVPLSWAMSLIGWRGACLVLAGATIVIALALSKFVQDPPAVDHSNAENRTGLRDLLKIWPLYPVLAMAAVAYAPAAGLRGSWAGGYLSDVSGLTSDGIGRVTFFMALSMIAGALAYGPMDRIIRSRKRIVLIGTFIALACLIWLWLGAGTQSVWQISALLVGIGFFGSAYGQIINHGRLLLPDRLTGRGVTLINLFSIGGAGLFQMGSARVFAGAMQHTDEAIVGYRAVFGLFVVLLSIGFLIYLTSKERRT